MIHAVHYEPHSQRQQFEPQESPEHDLEQSPPFFFLHLRLSLGMRPRRPSRSLIARVTTIFAAFAGALSLALGPYWTQAQGTSTPPMFNTLFGLAGHLVIAGALLGGGAVLLGGIPLVVSAWRTSPRSRFLFLIPILAGLLTGACALLIEFLMALGFQRPPLIFPVLLFYGSSFVSTIAIISAIRQARIADRWLRLANHLSRLVVAGMVLAAKRGSCR